MDAAEVCAELIGAVAIDHPVRVAIDGITAAGKTTFAEHLASVLTADGRSVLRVSMDGFHNRRDVRYRQGRSSSDGYYEDAYDIDSLRRVLLDPLGPGGDLRYRASVLDLASDVPTDDGPFDAEPGDVLIVDGSFLQKPEIRRSWDLVVFLRASFAAAAERGARRDAELLGGLDAARAAFRDRYHAAQRRYLAECDPEHLADVVVDVEDPTAPTVVDRRVPG
ncbi:MAG: uridine kinase [Microthrixaceae bacterium]|nr:hypothetical protein [Microthrixaceae bacterium]MCB9375766.1 uridine kinase [Microthrixaceae bacterium]MCC6183626.1 uridine kinase [Microthrixaceae bacterium]